MALYVALFGDVCSSLLHTLHNNGGDKQVNLLDHSSMQSPSLNSPVHVAATCDKLISMRNALRAMLGILPAPQHWNPIPRANPIQTNPIIMHNNSQFPADKCAHI